jgi:hypothetical protein
MSIPLENARLCLDCDTVFDEPRCPSCSSESFFPLSRWVRPANESLQAAPSAARKNVRNTSLVLGSAGVAFALWKLFRNGSPTKPSGKKDTPERN